MSTPEATYLEDSYRFVWEKEGAEILMERFDERGGGIHVEIQFRTTRPPKPGLLLGPVDLNVKAERSINSMASKVEKRQPDIDWDGLLTQACHLAILRYRQGEPLVDLVALSREPAPAVEWVVEPYWERNPSVLFADGNSGKSSIAVALAVSVATGEPIFGDRVELTGRVLYLDWEADPRTHANRLAAIVDGAGIDLPNGAIEYRRIYTSLKESAKDIRRQIVEHGFVAVIIDSLGGAKGDDAETNTGSIEAFNAIRALGVPAFIVDHVTHASAEAAEKKGDVPMVPFGGRYTRNYARLMWGMRATRDDATGHMYQRLKMRKGNNVGQMFERTMRMTYELDEEYIAHIRWEPVNRMEVPEVKRSAWTKIMGELLSHEDGLTVAELADLVGEQERTIRRALERHSSDIHNVSSPGQVGRYCLHSRYYAKEGTHTTYPLLREVPGGTPSSNRGVPTVGRLEEGEEEEDPF